jgi:transposase
MDRWSTEPHENRVDLGGRTLVSIVGRRGRHSSGEVETAGLSDPERAYEPMIVNRVLLRGNARTRDAACFLAAQHALRSREERKSMSHNIAALDVHKKVLMAVVTDASGEEEQFEKRKFGARPSDLKVLHEWLDALQVKEVVMESTAQYWKPVWQELEGSFHLELAQAQSNRGPKGRKSDFKDATRLGRRYLADELILSFVPDPEQRLWRTQARTKARWTRERARTQNRLEALLEEMRIKLSSVVSDLLGVSARRMLRAIAKGEKDVEKLAEMAEANLHASKETLCDALQAVNRLDPRYLPVLRQFLDHVEMAEKFIEELDQELAASLKPHGNSVERLAAVPGLGVDSAQQIIAEVGPKAEKFPSAGQLSSWVGSCPGEETSAEESSSDRSPKGNRYMRRILNQAANAAVKAKGTVFEAHYRRIKAGKPKRHAIALWAVANRICRLVWKILHDSVPYEERGNRPNTRAVKKRAAKLLRELKCLGYRVQVEARPQTIQT